MPDELGSIFGYERIATIKGGPLEDKIATVESFWAEDGAQFLISTSAGGEGINLQIGRILFNIEERMADSGVSLEIESEPGKGCRAILTVPLGTDLG